MANDFDLYPPLDIVAIEAAMSGCVLGYRVIYRQQLTSTNDVAAAMVRSGDADGMVIFADSQSCGRGTSGRTWLSQQGRNLLFSVVLPAEASVLDDESLVMTAALAVAEGCEQAASLPRGSCQLKWPNDVLLDKRKLAGILCERRHGVGCSRSVVGMGINVNAVPDSERLRREPVSLCSFCGEVIDRSCVAISVLGRLGDLVSELAASRLTLAQLRQKWSARSCSV